MRKLTSKLIGLKFTKPTKNAVVILHEDDFWLRTLILKELPATTIKVYPETKTLYFGIELVVHFIRVLFCSQWKSFLFSTRKEALKELYCCYLMAILEVIEAQVVLTHIDNSRLFQRMSRIDRRRSYFAIQNGTRTLACVRDTMPPPPNLNSQISMTNFFCFGQRDVDLFRAHKHKIDRYLPVGSLKSGCFMSSLATKPRPVNFDLCYVSQWHSHFYSNVEHDYDDFNVGRRVRLGLDGLHSMIERLLNDTDLTMVVCLRSFADDGERGFFERLFGNRVTLIDPDRANLSTHNVAMSSRLVVALNSTVLAEVFSLGQKVLWCNTSSDERFMMPEAGISYFAGNDYNSFKERVSHLLKMPTAGFSEENHDRAQYINVFDHTRPAHVIIRDTIVKSLTVCDKS